MLFLVKHSRPDIANATKELLKTNDGENPVAFKELLLCVIKYLFNTTNFGLKMEPTRNANEACELVWLSDSNYAADAVSGRSMSGFIVYV